MGAGLDTSADMGALLGVSAGMGARHGESVNVRLGACLSVSVTVNVDTRAEMGINAYLDISRYKCCFRDECH